MRACTPAQDRESPEGSLLPESLQGAFVYMVGIKGTGMAALAELLHRRGARVNGSDRPERFYTDRVLGELGIPYAEGFSAGNLPEKIDLAVYSAAYDPAEHPELRALRDRAIPLTTYPEALGYVSRLHRSTGIAGVHGKTTTTALTAMAVKALDLPASVLVGSAVPALEEPRQGAAGRSTLVQGDSFFVAETCEYRRHFLHFSPERIVLTSVEPDHLDYFRDAADVEDAFAEYIRRLPEGGELIYCADDPGARRTAEGMGRERPDLRLVPYGEEAEGAFRVRDIARGESEGHPRTLFHLEGWPNREFSLRIPGRHTVLDAAAAAAAAWGMARDAGGAAEEGGSGDKEERGRRIAAGLEAFTGSRRRSEILGEAGGVLFMDDYGHHPTALRTTLEGIRDFYPGRRLVADFMSHTYSRTAALLEEFAGSFGQADLLILHGIYASAREEAVPGISGELLYRKTAENRRRQGFAPGDTLYYRELDEARKDLAGILCPGDLFITLGAGNNWTLGRALFEERKEAQ